MPDEVSVGSPTHPPMRLPRLLRPAAAAALLAAVLPNATRAQTPAPLRVIRVTPSGDAAPLAEITVTFDRPVAGSLDRTVDPRGILHVVPEVHGRVEWRDPVTIRLSPAAPLAPGATYAVTVANDFHAMDGSALPGAYRFQFRVHGPLLLAGVPIVPDGRPNYARLDQRFRLVFSSPVDLAMLSRAAYLELSASCGGRRIVPLRALSQRGIEKDDEVLEEAGGWQRNRAVDSLRRVVLLAPDTTLPRGCPGELVAPMEVEAPVTHGYARVPFATHGDFHVATLVCNDTAYCPTGPLWLRFSTPVRGSEVLHHVHLFPETKFSVRDTLAESDAWVLEAKLNLHTGYAAYADTSMRDVFGQPLTGNPAVAFRTTGYAPTVMYPYGRLLVERVGFRTLAVQHVNVDTLVAIIAPVPDTVEPRILTRFAWNSDSVWDDLVRGATVQRIPVRSVVDHPMITGVRLPLTNAARPGSASLFAVRISGRSGGADVAANGPVALVQVTNLAVHARVGAAEGVVWVTGVNDGLPRQGATIALHDAEGRLLATALTDPQGIARLASLAVTASDTGGDAAYREMDGYVTATLADDRALTAINRWDPDLSPWRFNVESAWGDQRFPLAGAVFTERGIYRPGERVHAKAIVRDGQLGALRVPAPRDSIRLIFHDRDEGILRQRTVALSSFGTADEELEIPAAAAVGQYQVELQARRQGRWRSVASTVYRVAEYRPPEFLVDLNAPAETHFPGGTFAATLQARYLFGAPMGRAVVRWTATRIPVSPWELSIPGTDGWYVGDHGAWWEESEEPAPDEFASGTDTLDARGERALQVKIPPTTGGRPARVTLAAEVADVNRQVVGASASTLVHPAEFYIAAKTVGTDWFWKAGTPQSVQVITVRPSGEKVSGVRVAGTIVRREWHQVRRERHGMSELVGEWVSDTVARCTVTTGAQPERCTFTPTGGGIYVVNLTATDSRGRVATTSFDRWASGEGWVPWSDETQCKMDVIPDRTRYSVGDTATVMFASPFTNAEAWITVEREGLIEQRRMRITSGSTTLKFPITEAFAPNAFVSIIVVRGRSAPPGPLDDPGRPTMRVGYAELRVTPEVKRLAVRIAPARNEYRPGDVARVGLQVRDALGHGARSEVTLWAVDEGVLALTGYTTPDPIDLIYRERGLGMRLASNLTSVAPQVPEGEKGRREPGGGGGAEGADILRSRFRSTAFFLGSVVTDASGNAVATAKLPDNLTSFRVMAVAVTAGDRYGKGQSTLLVTRPLLARQALPRFVRPGDEFTAGAVINRRDGRAATVEVSAAAAGVALQGEPKRTATLAPSRGAEVRFPFVVGRDIGRGDSAGTDSAVFRFDVAGEGDADAVRVALPVKPDHHPRALTVAGVLRDTATLVLALPPGIDPARSRVSLSLGVSPLATIRGMAGALHVYPYDCSEQVISAAVPLIALYRAHRDNGLALPGDPDGALARAGIARAAGVLVRRQRADGGIGYWSAIDWTTPWLSTYAGMVLLDARDLGVHVDTAVFSRLEIYLTRELHNETKVAFTPVAFWYTDNRAMRLRDQVAAVDFLSRFGRPDVVAENELLRGAAQLTPEDRARLAQVFARRRQLVPARALLGSVWALVRVEGRRATLPDSLVPPFYFASRMRPVARVLTATLAIDPENALVGPLVETLAQQSRAARADWMWNTQDYASAITALALYDSYHRARGERTVSARAGDRVILAAGPAAGSRDSTVALAGLVGGTPDAPSLRVALDAGAGDAPVYYYMTVTDVPVEPPVTPDDRGIQVERWYESYPGGQPVTRVAEGDLVRVRLRIRVTRQRQFVVLDDALPAGLEAVDLSLRTASAMAGPGAAAPDSDAVEQEGAERTPWGWYGSWDSGWWSPFDHREIRDDRVVYAATFLWPGTYTATYVARATTPGSFVRPPAYSEEMYNPGLNGRSDGGRFTVDPKP